MVIVVDVVDLMIFTAHNFHHNSCTILHSLFLMYFTLHDFSLPLINALDESELALVREATLHRSYYLTTFQDYL